MIDIKFLRENPEVVKENIKKKFQDKKLPLVDEVIELDKYNRVKECLPEICFIFKRSKKFNILQENLKELANLRLENPEATYEELGKMLSKPIGKSGVSHRLNKLNQIAKEF